MWLEPMGRGTWRLDLNLRAGAGTCIRCYVVPIHAHWPWLLLFLPTWWWQQGQR